MTMGKVERYREKLRKLVEWEPFLLEESGLPGPRGNLELAQVVAEEGDQPLFEHFLSFGPAQAPTNYPQEFLAFCGVVGLGRLLAEGQRELLPRLRPFASDQRWRTREAVAMALQRWGQVDMDALLEEMEHWSRGDLLEKRAAAAALCEPKLLQEPRQVAKVLTILDAITTSILSLTERKSEEFRTLRQGLGYCWSVAVVALPEEGKELMEKWSASSDPDVRWIMRENLSKKRLQRLDAQWVESCRSRLGT